MIYINFKQFTFSIIGLWHGISINFLLFGLFHGTIVSIENVMPFPILKPIKLSLPKLYLIIKTVFIFILVTFGWILFTYDISGIIFYFKGMFLC